MSKIEDSVIDDLMQMECDWHTKQSLSRFIDTRARIGKAKYGVTLERTDLSQFDWETHLQEELCDALGYAKRLSQFDDYDGLLKEMNDVLLRFATTLEGFRNEQN